MGKCMMRSVVPYTWFVRKITHPLREEYRSCRIVTGLSHKDDTPCIRWSSVHGW